jgi:hypothetical protein
MSPQTARPTKAMMSSLLWIVSRRYGWVRKKLRLRVDETAVATAAHRPPSSATTMMRARKTNVRLEAVVTSLNGINAIPRRTAAIGPPPRKINRSSSDSVMVTPPGSDNPPRAR